MSSFADFTTKLQDTLQLAVKLGEEVKTLVISTNEMEHYFNSTNTTGSEWETFTTISKKVTNLSSEAVQLAERASDEIHIAFIGTINAGKTTLINRLLQADVLPVMNGETTFCNVAISGTAEKQMIAIERKSGEILPADSLKELLNVLKAKPEREKFGIEPNSVIDVKSPKEGCRALVENVVLYDTPGIGHRKETDDAVVDLCKKVDVIVAVMDTHSPSLRIVSGNKLIRARAASAAKSF